MHCTWSLPILVDSFLYDLHVRSSPLQLSTANNCCKELLLKCDRVAGFILKTSPCAKTSPLFLGKPVFVLIILEYGELYYIKIHFFLSILFYRMMNFLSSLLDICYNYLVFMDPVIGFSKSKLLFRIASFIKM